MTTAQLPLLERPVGLATRQILRRFLLSALETVPRLQDSEDSEALHDFRVAIRRTRSAGRSWRDVLAPDIKKRHLRSLASLQGATGDGRDAEVMLDWIGDQRDVVESADGVGVNWLMEVLDARKTAAYAQARQDVVGPLEALCGRMLGRLEAMSVPVDPDGASVRTYGEALGLRARAQVSSLGRRLRAANGLADQDALHGARIECKRLRYLVEPVRNVLPAAEIVVKQCKGLQDILGLIQDGAVLEVELETQRAALAAAAADDPRLCGLARLVELNQQRMTSQFERVVEDWLTEGLDALARTVETLTEIEGGALQLEIERKYLLDGLPPEARRGRQKFIDQGYLPGKKLIERVRRIKKDDGERYVRTIKVGKGLTRVELEEETDRETFDVLWGLTRGCRVSKTRYMVSEGEFVWEIDDFADRNLVLAEIELPTADTPVTIPDWLEPYLIREVTEDGQYTNWKLAK